MTTALAEKTSAFQAFADPTRLRILNLLGQGELCVCHLVEVLEAPQPKVSRHLALLRRAGLVAVRVEGPWRHYRLTPDAAGLTATLLGCLETCRSECPELDADAERLALLLTNASCG